MFHNYKRYCFFILPLILVSAFSQSRYILDCDENLQYVSLAQSIAKQGFVETKGNRGWLPDSANKVTGVPTGSPYCMSATYLSFYEAQIMLGNVDIPIQRSALAQSPFNQAKKIGNKTKFEPQVSDLIIWKTAKSWTGHIERIISVGKMGWITTIAHNTSFNIAGDQRGGSKKGVQGSTIKKRNLYHPLGRMNVRGLVGFENGEKK